MNAVLATDLVNFDASGDLAAEEEETCGVEEARAAFWPEGLSSVFSFQCDDFSDSMIRRDPTSDCSKNKNTALPWGRGHVHPCCRLCFDKQATALSRPSLHPCCRQHGHRLPTICSWVCGTAKIRYTRRNCENNVTQVLCHQHADTYSRVTHVLRYDHKAHLACGCHRRRSAT